MAGALGGVIGEVGMGYISQNPMIVDASAAVLGAAIPEIMMSMAGGGMSMHMPSGGFNLLGIGFFAVGGVVAGMAASRFGFSPGVAQGAGIGALAGLSADFWGQSIWNQGRGGPPIKTIGGNTATM